MTHGLDVTHSHGLETISGYRVYQTLEGNEILSEARLLSEWDGAETYGYALQEAQAVRREAGAWAVVDTLYSCGCRSYERGGRS